MDALWSLLANAYYEFTLENDLEPDSRVVQAAVQELSQITQTYGMDKGMWIAPVRECLQRTLGLDPEFIAARYLVNDVVSCLWASSENGELRIEAAAFWPVLAEEPED